MPHDTGRLGRRYVIRGGHVMSMDPAVGDFVEGKKIVAVGQNLDVRGRIIMPGFIDAHHHQFETALRSFLADGLLFNDGQPHGAINYFQHILGTFAPVYRPEDVYISELFGSLSQLDAEAINVHPLNVVLGAVVSLMERSNLETMIFAGKIRKWKGKLLDAAGGCSRPHD